MSIPLEPRYGGRADNPYATAQAIGAAAQTGALGQALGPAAASPTAQGNGQGIGIQNIRRGLLYLEAAGASDNAITATSYAPLPATPLSGDLVCSGRPVTVEIGGSAASIGTAPSLRVSVTMDGAEITGRVTGLFYTEAASVQTWSGRPKIIVPNPGTHTFALVAHVPSGSATIKADANNGLCLMVREV